MQDDNFGLTYYCLETGEAILLSIILLTQPRSLVHPLRTPSIVSSFLIVRVLHRTIRAKGISQPSSHVVIRNRECVSDPLAPNKLHAQRDSAPPFSRYPLVYAPSFVYRFIAVYLIVVFIVQSCSNLKVETLQKMVC